MSLANIDITRLINADHSTPHDVLGLQRCASTQYLILQAFLPQFAQKKNNKSSTYIEVIDANSHKSLGKLVAVNNQGLFTLALRRKRQFNYYFKVNTASQRYILHDPYGYSAVLTPDDIDQLQQGCHLKPNACLGAHTIEHQGVKGVSFTVWAPNATSVNLVGDFNNWHDTCHAMSNISHRGQLSGYWHIFMPQANSAQCYKYQISNSQQKTKTLKADPYGQQSQYRPENASVVASAHQYQWQDKTWLKSRKTRNSHKSAISIYEVHVGSWRRDKHGNFINFKTLANTLIPYVKNMAFTHIQLMPVSEYPYDGSWGYQPVGLFAVTARFGTKEDFKYFIDCCHQENIGVLIDWVPAHFPSDPHGLAIFDGSHLYEHQDPRKGFHPDWNTLIYNYGRTEVANFLTASAIHWLEDFHLDGIRVDAVASMLYLDYSRAPDQWLPNIHGGRENLEAVAFLQQLNKQIQQHYPDTISIAEESTAWLGVTAPVEHQGLGFNFKWNMGWMNDTLRYIKREPIHRKHHHNEMTFGLVYSFDEHFVLPISHDEVVHGKGSMIEKMPGDAWQQFANLRAYYGFMWAHPGKKLLFMGCEFAQGREWNFDGELDWHQLDIHWHKGVQTLVKDLNLLYQKTPALYELDTDNNGFQWLDHRNAEQAILSFIRYGDNREKAVIVISNFTPMQHPQYLCGVPSAGEYQIILNTDAQQYCGSGLTQRKRFTSKPHAHQGQPHHIEISVPPLSTVIYQRVASIIHDD